MLSQVSVSVQQYYEFDVTSYVQAQYSGDKIVTFELEGANDQDKNADFYSRESTTNKLEIVIVQ